MGQVSCSSRGLGCCGQRSLPFGCVHGSDELGVCARGRGVDGDKAMCQRFRQSSVKLERNGPWRSEGIPKHCASLLATLEGRGQLDRLPKRHQVRSRPEHADHLVVLRHGSRLALVPHGQVPHPKVRSREASKILGTEPFTVAGRLCGMSPNQP